jgi:hypothetical protein
MAGMRVLSRAALATLVVRTVTLWLLPGVRAVDVVDTLWLVLFVAGSAPSSGRNADGRAGVGRARRDAARCERPADGRHSWSPSTLPRRASGTGSWWLGAGPTSEPVAPLGEWGDDPDQG